MTEIAKAARVKQEIQVTDNAVFNGTLLYAMGRDMPKLNPTQMKEYWDAVEADWPFSKGEGKAVLEKKYRATTKGWIPKGIEDKPDEKVETNIIPEKAPAQR